MLQLWLIPWVNRVEKNPSVSAPSPWSQRTPCLHLQPQAPSAWVISTQHLNLFLQHDDDGGVWQAFWVRCSFPEDLQIPVWKGSCSSRGWFLRSSCCWLICPNCSQVEMVSPKSDFLVMKLLYDQTPYFHLPSCAFYVCWLIHGDGRVEFAGNTTKTGELKGSLDLWPVSVGRKTDKKVLWGFSPCSPLPQLNE